MCSNIDVKKLRIKMIERDLNVAEIAKRISINPSTMHRKINGESDFTVREMKAIAKELQMTDAETMDIFLRNDSQICENVSA